ncbi:MAG: hypothetical protein OHK0044_06170 [Burkholderiaceae bacterium]
MSASTWPHPPLRAGALVLVALVAACARPLRGGDDAPQSLRTADIVHAPAYREPTPAAPPAREPEPASGQSAAAPAAVAAPVDVPAPPTAPTPLAAEALPAPQPPAIAQPGPETAAPPLAPGRWAVQVGVFAVPANADAVRARVAAKIAQSDLAVPVRVERIGDRSHVLVGDLPDRAAAQALAARLRRVLAQDVVILRR